MTRPRGSFEVCVITSSGLVPGRGHLDVALGAIEGGAGAIQLRAPELPDEELLPLARAVAGACADRDVVFVVNDRLDVAIACGADGAHVGQGDDPTGARERLGAERLLGISVGSAEQARRAALAGADYLGVTVWPTSTKPDAAPVGLGGLREIASSTVLPVVAVGGIDAENAPEVILAGAAGVAVVSAIGAAPSMPEETRRLCASVHGALETRKGAEA